MAERFNHALRVVCSERFARGMAWIVLAGMAVGFVCFVYLGWTLFDD